ncbi:hypothetical protein Tcan_11780 [Toxocara canis]|uniref:Prisilkin-39 n=1 Tax=Toxocara canis TaxID=6265 RepID=A0A0B2V885_TOXCA|nr:hypothetical protein Tcan_11780 [Toxocara canis]
MSCPNRIGLLVALIVSAHSAPQYPLGGATSLYPYTYGGGYYGSSYPYTGQYGGYYGLSANYLNPYGISRYYNPYNYGLYGSSPYARGGVGGSYGIYPYGGGYYGAYSYPYRSTFCNNYRSYSPCSCYNSYWGNNCYGGYYRGKHNASNAGR